MLIILQKETNFLKKEPEVLEKQIKLARVGGVADNITVEDGAAQEIREERKKNPRGWKGGGRFCGRTASLTTTAS